MRRKILTILVATGLLMGLLGLFSIGHAQQFRHGNSATIGANETVDSSAYLAGRTIDVAGEVKGDLFCAGQNITISGTIRGDVICAGQTININGTVDGDVRVAGQDISVGASVANNLTVAGQSFTLNGNGKVGQDITGGVQTMNINGEVGRDMVLGASDATINGTVGRNIKSQIENLSLGSSAKVGGDINYTSSNNLSKAQGATVAGNVHRSVPVKHEHKNGWFGIGFRIYWFFAMLLVALVLVLLFPALFESTAHHTMSSFGLTLLLGIAVVLFTPVLFVLLMVTIVGIPLGLILMFAWVMSLILSGPFFAYLVGKEIWRAQKNPIWIMLVGAVILLLIYNIPLLGFLVMMAAAFIGTGMILRELTLRTPKPHYKVSR
jgi:cytoskeletal protein CcmA (bactofilin family)